MEAATIDFANPFIHQRHLAAAAYEGPLLTDDERFFGPGSAATPWSRGAADGFLAPEARRLVLLAAPASRRRRSACVRPSAQQFTIVEDDTGDIIGTEGAETAFSALHPGAVYLHMGDTYLVTDLDLDGRVALVRPFWDTYYTQARRETDTRILRRRPAGRRAAHSASTWAEIVVSSRVIAFQKKRLGSDEVLGTEELDLPTQEFVTEGMWFTIPPELLPDESDLLRLPGAIHAIEHALIALLPLLAMCDRWDIGGLSTPVHPQTEQPTIFVYDGHPGGVGISRQGFDRFAEWAARRPRPHPRLPLRVPAAPPASSRPSAATSNEPLDKELALSLLEAMLC